MKKLLLSSYSGLPNKNEGGPNRIIYQILNEIDLQKFEIKFLSYDAEVNYSKNKNVKNEEFLLRNIGKFLYQNLKYYRLITSSNTYLTYHFKKRDRFFEKYQGRLSQFDIIHSHDSLVHYHYRNLNKSKKILTIQSKGSLVKEMQNVIGKNWFHEKIIRDYFNREKIAFSTSDIIVFPSIAAKNYFLSDLQIDSPNNNKIKIIYNGIDLDYIKRIKQLDLTSELKIDISKFSPIILNVAAHVPEKKIDLLVKSIGALKSIYNMNPLLLNIGTDLGSDKIANLVIRMGLTENVKLLGKKSNEFVIAAMKSSEYFIMTSEKVIFDLVILEALACGCCLIVSDSGGNKEIIKDDKNGFLLKELNAFKIAEKINLLENYSGKKNIKLNAISTSLNYNVSNMVNKYIEMYSELI